MKRLPNRGNVFILYLLKYRFVFTEMKLFCYGRGLYKIYNNKFNQNKSILKLNLTYPLT